MAYFEAKLKAKVAYIKEMAELVEEMDDDDEFIFANLKLNEDLGLYCPTCGEYKTFKEYGIRRTVPGAKKHSSTDTHIYCDQPMCSSCRKR